MKKFLASAVSAAMIITGPGYATVFAANVQAVPTHVAPAGLNTAAAAAPSLQEGTGIAPITGIAAPALSAPGAADAIQLGGPKEGPAASAPSAAEAIAPNIGEVVETIRSEQPGSEASARVLDSLYTGDRSQTASIGSISIEPMGRVNGSTLGASSRRSVSQRAISIDAAARAADLHGPASDMKSVFGRLTRIGDLISYVIEAIGDRFTDPKTRAQKVLSELQNGEDTYNGLVNTTKQQVEKMEGVQAQQEKDLAAANASAEEKAQQVHAAKEGTPAYDKANEALLEIAAQIGRIEEDVNSTKEDVALATAQYQKALKDRRGFFEIKSSRLRRIQSRMNQNDAADVENGLTAAKKRFQLDGEEQMKKIDKAVGEKSAAAKAGRDALDSSAAAQKIDAEQGAKEKAASNRAADLLKKFDKKSSAGETKTGGSMINAGAAQKARVLLAIVGAGFAVFNPIPVFIALVAAGTAALFVLPPKAAQETGRVVAMTGLLTGTIGLGTAKLMSMVGFSVALAGASNLFLVVAVVGTGLGLWAAISGYRAEQAVAQAASGPVEAPQRLDLSKVLGSVASRMGNAASSIAHAGSQAVKGATSQTGAKVANAADGAATAIETGAQKIAQAADDMASQPVQSADLSKAANKAVEAGKTIAGAAVKAGEAVAAQTGAAVAKAADKGAEKIGEIAQQVSKAADAAEKNIPTDAPSASAVANKAAKVGGELASAAGRLASAKAQEANANALKGADSVIAKLEQIKEQVKNAATTAEGDNAARQAVDAADPKNAEGWSVKLKRIVDVAMTIIGLKTDQALDRLESSPEYQAYKMQTIMARAEKNMQGQVYQAAYNFHLLEGQIADNQKESARLDKLIKTLVAPGPKGEEPSQKDMSDAMVLRMEQKRSDLAVIDALENMGKARAAVEKAAANRAMIFAQNAETMIAIKSGLTKAMVADLQARTEFMQQDYLEHINAATQKFSEAVRSRVAAGQAAEDVAEADPSVILARAKAHAENLNVQNEVMALKGQLAAK